MQCKKCGKTNDPEASFCEQCGTSLKTMACPKCGKENDPDGQFCKHCGASLKNQTCPKCGKENKPGSQFCKYCGQALDQAVVPPAPLSPDVTGHPSSSPVITQRRGMPAWGWVLISLSALSLILFLGFMFKPKALTGSVPTNPPAQIGSPTSGTILTSIGTRQPATINTPTKNATEIAYPVPTILQKSLVNPRIDNLETFDHWTRNGWSYISENVSVVSDGGNILQLPGTPDWGTVAALPAFRQNQGALTKFKLSGSSFNIEFHLIQNEWNTPAYKRFGGLLCCKTNTIKTAIQEGTDTHLYDQAMSGTLVFNPDHWYGLFIGADTTGGFRFLAWDWEDAGKYAWYEYQGGNAWANGEWIFEVPVDTGTVFLDDFSIISFDGFNSFPELGTIKPPTSTPPLPPSTGAVIVSVSMDTNCRTGPGEKYPSIGSLMIGETAEVVGRSPGGDFWIIKNLDDPGNCWLWAIHATVIGVTSKLPIIQPPPTPTPTPKPATPTWTPTLTTTTYTFNGSFWVEPNPVPYGAWAVFHGTGFPPGAMVELRLSRRVNDDWVYFTSWNKEVKADGSYLDSSGYTAISGNQPEQELVEIYYDGNLLASAVFIINPE
jgi:hypothetical protein